MKKWKIFQNVKGHFYTKKILFLGLVIFTLMLFTFIFFDKTIKNVSNISDQQLQRAMKYMNLKNMNLTQTNSLAD